jgi:hypothetical protein
LRRRCCQRRGSPQPVYGRCSGVPAVSGFGFGARSATPRSRRGSRRSPDATFGPVRRRRPYRPRPRTCRSQSPCRCVRSRSGPWRSQFTSAAATLSRKYSSIWSALRRPVLPPPPGVSK